MSLGTALSIPTTDIPPISVGDQANGGGGIEYKGKLYMSRTKKETNVPTDFVQIVPSYSSKELWFMAKLSESYECKNKENISIPFLAKIWATKKEIGCTYDKTTEDTISSAEQILYCL